MCYRKGVPLFLVLSVLLFLPMQSMSDPINTYAYQSVCPDGYEPDGVTRSDTIPGGLIFRDKDEDKWIPYDPSNPQGSAYWKDKWNFAQCNCTSYSAHMVNIYGVPFVNGQYPPSNPKRWGNGGNWDDVARSVGIPVDQNPLPGDIAYWNTKGGVGHVATVFKVRFDTNGNKIGIDYEQYNVTPNDWSFEENASIDDPDGYIHILAYEEGVSSTHYMDCYEMSSLCDFQTRSEWERILTDVNRYRCKDCDGTYRVAAETFYGGEVFGGGTEASGSYPISGSTSSGKLPDILVNLLNVEDAGKNIVPELHIGDRGYCRMQLKNSGTAKTDSFSTRCWLSDGLKIDKNPIDLGKEDTKNIDPGKTHTEHEDFAAPIYPGPYNVVACGDSEKQRKELNEDNNCKLKTFRVWSDSDPAMINLYFGVEKTTFDPGESFEMHPIVANNGENIGSTAYIGYSIDGVPQSGATDRILREHLEGGMIKADEVWTNGKMPMVSGQHVIRACVSIDPKIDTDVRPENNCMERVVTVRDSFESAPVSCNTIMSSADWVSWWTSWGWNPPYYTDASGVAQLFVSAMCYRNNPYKLTITFGKSGDRVSNQITLINGWTNAWSTTVVSCPESYWDWNQSCEAPMTVTLTDPVVIDTSSKNMPTWIGIRTVWYGTKNGFTGWWNEVRRQGAGL